MILVKAGGGETVNWPGLAADIAAVRETESVIVIHGAHFLRDTLAARLGVPVRKVVSPSGVTSVYTDEEALDVFLMAYPGLANKRIVAHFVRSGVNAVGLSGVDGRLWQAKAKKDLLVRENGKTKLLRKNLTGRVDSVNVGLLRLLIEGGYVPVLSAPAISEEGEIVNTDNDGAAAVLAEQMGIERLVFLFEAPGLLRDPRRPETLVHRIPRSSLDEFMGCAEDRMQKKLLGVKRAFEGGAKEVYFGDGRGEHPLREALAGLGTVIY
jgi:[amino group carrier protein]-L-2-aminoadipate/L-glutamate 6-kinase